MKAPAQRSSLPRRRPAFAVAGGLAATVAFLVLLEGALRLIPSAIPLGVLEQFEPALRSRIAVARRLPTRKDTVLIPRSDGGPADLLWVYRPHTEVTWAFDEPGIAKTVEMDERGFCNPPAVSEREPAALVAIGDSFTFCTAVVPEATWVSGLGQKLGIATDNLALPGRGLYEYLELLRNYGLEHVPRVVAMTVYEGNDYRDAVVFHSARGKKEAGATSACPTGGPLCRAALALRSLPVLRSSYAVNLIAGASLRLGLSARKSEIDFRYAVDLADGSTLTLNSRNGDRDEVEFAAALIAKNDAALLFGEALDAFAELGREKGFHPLLVYVPAAYTAYRERARFEDARIQTLMADYSDRLRAYFHEATEARGIEFLDATAALATAATGEATRADPIYFPGNVHLTPGGHRVLAREIAARAQTWGLADATAQRPSSAKKTAPGTSGPGAE